MYFTATASGWRCISDYHTPHFPTRNRAWRLAKPPALGALVSRNPRIPRWPSGSSAFFKPGVRVDVCISARHHWVTPAYPTTPNMSSVSTSAAVGPIELSVRNRHEDADVVPILDDGNDILAASRLADSTVPDGGYGWILIAACGIVTFWFVGVFQSVGPNYTSLAVIEFST